MRRGGPRQSADVLDGHLSRQPIGSLGPAVSSAGDDVFLGSLPVTGRVTAIAPDPSNSNTVYIGAAAGGPDGVDPGRHGRGPGRLRARVRRCDDTTTPALSSGRSAPDVAAHI